MSDAPDRLIHLVSSLEVGGKERVVLDLAHRARGRGLRHELLLFDAPFRSPGIDFDPGAVPWSFEPRGPGLDLGFARRLTRRLNGFEVVHAHNDTAIFYGALARALGGRWRRTSRPRLVGTFHTLPGYDTPRARRLTRWATGRAESVTAVSDELAERLDRLGWSRPPDVVWNGVDARHYASGRERRDAWRARLGVGQNEFLVGQLARFDPIKRQVDLLTAVRALRASGAAMHVAFAGHGPLHDSFRDAYGALPWVHLPGALDDVPGFLAALDACVLCSDHEAAPRSILEAFAAGKAFVATAVGGIPTLVGVGPDAAAVLVPPRSPERIAEALDTLLRDPQSRRQLEARAVRRAGRFSANAEWAEYRKRWNGVQGPGR